MGCAVPSEVKWYFEDRVLYERLYGTVTLDDIRSLNIASKAFLANGTPLVHVIVDLSEVERFPTSLATIKEFVKPAPNQKALGWVILFGTTNPLLRFLSSVVTQLAGENVRMRVMDELGETLDFIRKQDETLSHIPLPE